ncbi:pentapeptide repeat-containing protein [Nostoc sp. TCL240-02]|uniref:pentapeptide repeat-containing protein n=1 Tax=Nostoc sp. TCL240-02 TaxID=2572090 RepID=UPI00157F9876|nr:pentapeptide repeat-containing protein [Nostoc sp. TCL240-02]QKQ75599.1 pentapeptide repeat-containing protein [Nostoc sp. TCL240-02]
MIDPSFGRKKKKITITASPKGIHVAENALIRLGFESKLNFAKSQLLSRSTVTKFFKGEPIQLDSFKRICEALKLDWREIAGIIEQRQPKQLPTSSYSSPDSDEVVEQVQPEHRKVTVIDKQSQKIKAVITLEGDIDSVQNWKIIQSVIREHSGDTIQITDIKEGSIRLFVEGSPEDIELLVSRIKSGELKTVTGFPVKDVQILSESSDDETTESDKKWHLVRKIVNQRVEGRKLRGTDLSNADLSGANLIGANLSGADLSDADLSDANLSDANLIGADLSGADLSDANLVDANLIGADLSDADLSDANLSGAHLSRADLSRADLNRAYLSSAYLNRANLSAANLSAANLVDANLVDANLSAANLVDANLNHANLNRANLVDANLNHANLNRANLVDANLNHANLNHANLNRANLVDANLSAANLVDANLSDAILTDAILESTIVMDALFDGSIGLTEDMKRDLERRGAVFGDRPPVLSAR